MQVRDYSKCANRCMIDCRANLRGGQCIAPFKEVPAPTVATDNSGEHPSACAKCFDWKECFEFGCQKPEASPVEEEQEELWMQVAVDCHGITIKGVSKVIKELSDKFIITRKS